MDPFWDPKTTPTSINFVTSKRYLKMTFLGHRNGIKQQKKNVVYSSVL